MSYFYFGCCHKYNFRQKTNKSLAVFMEKLREKKQFKKQKREAHHIVTLCFELVFRSAEKVANNRSQGQNLKEN